MEVFDEKQLKKHICAGILAHVGIKAATRKWKEIHPGLYILCIPLILYFIYN